MAALEHVDLYGLRIRSELPLHQDRTATLDDGRPIDVDIHIGAPMTATDETPAGRVLLDLETDRHLYSAVQADDGSYLLRFHRTCDFVIAADLATVTLHMVDGRDLGLAAVLATGTMLSFLLTMRGHPVLHASAVQVGEAAVAFVGASGMGKSTMATLLCADGATLITDDVLRLDIVGDGAPRCFLGATELRLRKAASHLADRFASRPGQRQTSDGRDALRMPQATVDRLPVAALIIPVPDHDTDRADPEVERLAGSRALLALLSFPRVLGWVDQAVIDRQFGELADLVERVPVFVARLPWGPPFPDALGSRLLDALDTLSSDSSSG